MISRPRRDDAVSWDASSSLRTTTGHEPQNASTPPSPTSLAPEVLPIDRGRQVGSIGRRTLERWRDGASDATSESIVDRGNTS